MKHSRSSSGIGGREEDSDNEFKREKWIKRKASRKRREVEIYNNKKKKDN